MRCPQGCLAVERHMGQLGLVVGSRLMDSWSHVWMQCVPNLWPQCRLVQASTIPSGLVRPTGSWQMGHSSRGGGGGLLFLFLGESSSSCGIVVDSGDELAFLNKSFLRSFRLTLGTFMFSVLGN